MHVRLIFSNRITSIDTLADGSETFTKSTLVVRGNFLILKTATFADNPDPQGAPIRKTHKPMCLLEIEETTTPMPISIIDYLDAAGEQRGLRRLDVDGEVIWEKEVDYD